MEMGLRMRLCKYLYTVFLLTKSTRRSKQGLQYSRGPAVPYAKRTMLPLYYNNGFGEVFE